jgi:pimeloyl-ACP methyl ester carboxylesterase
MMPRTPAHRRVVAALALLAAAGCGGRLHPTPGGVAADPPLALRPCVLPGVAGEAACGVDSVWEDRSARRGRRIGLRVVVLRARDGAPARDPIVVLAGGPGQGAATMAPMLARELDGLRARRDLVLVDQRGTGASNPLTCDGGLAVLADTTGVAARACAAALAPRADVRHYTTAAAVEDLDEVRAALGYARINLLGVSYGTRVAQVYLRRHPDRVRSVTLRAVAPLGFNIPRDGGRAAQAALARLVTDCAADAACATAFPRLATDLARVRAHAADAPTHTRVATGGGDSVDVLLDRTLVDQTLNALLLSAATRQQLPLLLHRASADGLAALAPVAAQVRAAVYGQLPAGMYLSIVCTEDAPALRATDRAASADTFLAAAAGIAGVCRGWPHLAPPPDADARAVWPGPALLVSGDADPATVAEGAEGLARSWPGARHVVLPATAHGPMFPGCARDLVVAFVERATGAALDASCVRALAWPPFATRTAGR